MSSYPPGCVLGVKKSVSSTVCINSEKFNVRDDLYRTRHCACSRSGVSVLAEPFRDLREAVKRISIYIKDVALLNQPLGFKTAVSCSYVNNINMNILQLIAKKLVLKMLLKELGHEQEKITLFLDNESALYLARNPSFHSRTIHIRVQHHFVHEKVEERTMDMQKIHSDDNVAYLTKAINRDKFRWCRSSSGLTKM
ncbi:hypothetical protein Tco_0849533 [Tanacetum coccineum]